MKKLSEILNNIITIAINGNEHIYINNIIFDSREVDKDDLFIAIKGTKTDGHKFIDKAIDKGASVVVYSDECPICKDIISIKVDDTTVVLAKLAANFFDNPSEKLKIIGITGTNGKTTTATTLYNLF
ncbi:MAG: Mur ligase domain-containing protein, partial [Bacteroidota bacterium]|nr:Mur ligase domain-containing protein [Bacteroidota bacterium]